MNFGIKGKRALILGSSTGLGFAIAQALAQEGAAVIITSRDLERAKKAADSIPGAQAFACNLLEEGAGRKIVEEVGAVDILVTNAGGPPKGAFVDLSPEDWEAGYRGLWMSAIESIQAVLPGMIEKKWGRILLSTSTAAKEPIPNLTVSNAYRSGLLGLMKTISNEVAADGVTVNALLPGFMQTERLKELKVSEEDILSKTPAKRLGYPEELGALAAFLASDQAAYITGQSIACDGGRITGV